MRNARADVLLSAVLVTAAAASAQEVSKQQPGKGATTAATVETVGRLGSSDGATARKAREQLVLGGAASVPALLEVLKRGDAGKEPAAQRGKLDLEIFIVLRHLGAAGAEALPALIDQLDEIERVDRQCRTALLEAMGAIGPFAPARQDAEEALAGMVRFGGFSPRHYIATISRLQVDASAPLKDLLELLGDDNPFKRGAAADALVGRGPDARQAVEALVRALLDKERRRFVLQAGEFTVRSGGPRPEARLRIALALARIAPESPHAREGHTLLLADHPVVRERMRAAIALGRPEGDAAVAVAALRKALQDPEPGVVREVVTALGMIGPAARDAAPDLQRLAKSPDPQLGKRAQAALRKIQDPDARPKK